MDKQEELHKLKDCSETEPKGLEAVTTAALHSSEC